MSDTPEPLDAEPLAVGDVVLDRYRVVERITAGGHSLVFRGIDERLSRPVCIKVFRPRTECDGVYRTSYEHFVQEAFALSRLTHPNTLRIFDFGHLGGTDDGAPFQVSEFMNGGTLSLRVRTDGPFVADRAADMLDALCGALAEAHGQGLTHRDIKPQNILFLESGARRTVKLADFGIAKFSPSSEEGLPYRAGDTNVIAGRALLMLSPTWAAPEQMTGDNVGPWSDVYSMALIAAYATTGRAIFLCREPDEAYRLRIDSDQRIDEVLADSDVPAGFIGLVKRACDIDPVRRPPSIEALARDLRDVLTTPSRSAARLLPLPTPPDDSIDAPPAPLRARISLSEPPLTVGDRRVSVVALDGNVASVTCQRARLEVSLIGGTGGLMVHVKPLTCFVAIAGKRPTSAIQLDASEFLDFVLPNQQPIARARLCLGRAAAGHLVFELGDIDVALPVDECRGAVALDFGPGAECFFVYQPISAQLPAATSAGLLRKRR